MDVTTATAVLLSRIEKVTDAGDALKLTQALLNLAHAEQVSKMKHA